MGTKGFYTYRHKGIYYPYLRYQDGYPQGLGMELVSQIPSDEQGFKAWLKSKRDFYDGEAEKLREQKHISDEDEDEEEDEDEDKGFSGYIFKPSQDFPKVGHLHPNWVYVFDLDQLLFSVHRQANFNLDNIPRGDDGNEWIYYLAHDGCGRICLRPDTPREYKATLISSRPASEEGLVCYDTFRSHVTCIRESTWMAPDGEKPLLASSQVLASTVVRGLMMHHYQDLCDCAFSETVTFQVMAECLLRVAAPCGISLKEDCSEPYYYFCIPREGGVFYRFRGCIILLSENLFLKEQVEANVGLAVLHARKTGAEKSTVILWSIHHVAVAIISDTDGHLQVSLSEVYPVYDAYGVDETGLAKGLGILAYYLRPHCVEDAPNLASALDEELSTVELPVTRAVQNSQVPQDPALPYEIIFHIMGFVDSKTYYYFQYVSKDLRLEWAAYPRISNYTVLSVASVNKQANSYLPDVTLNVKVDNGPSKQLNLFYTHCASHDDKPFDRDNDDFGSCTYPSPYTDRKMDWRNVAMRLHPSTKNVEERRRLDYQHYQGDAPLLDCHGRASVGLYILEESNVLESCDGCQEPDS